MSLIITLIALIGSLIPAFLAITNSISKFSFRPYSRGKLIRTLSGLNDETINYYKGIIKPPNVRASIFFVSMILALYFSTIWVDSLNAHPTEYIKFLQFLLIVIPFFSYFLINRKMINKLGRIKNLLDREEALSKESRETVEKLYSDFRWGKTFSFSFFVLTIIIIYTFAGLGITFSNPMVVVTNVGILGAYTVLGSYEFVLSVYYYGTNPFVESSLFSKIFLADGKQIELEVIHLVPGTKNILISAGILTGIGTSLSLERVPDRAKMLISWKDITNVAVVELHDNQTS